MQSAAGQDIDNAGVFHRPGNDNPDLCDKPGRDVICQLILLRSAKKQCCPKEKSEHQASTFLVDGECLASRAKSIFQGRSAARLG